MTNPHTDKAGASQQDVQVLQVGISGKVEPKSGPFLVIVYQMRRQAPNTPSVEKSVVFRCRHIPVPINPVSDAKKSESPRDVWIERTLRRLKSHPRHSILIHQISESQLHRLLLHIYDAPQTKANSQLPTTEEETVVPDGNRRDLPFSFPTEDDNSKAYPETIEDLNLLTDDELAHRKAQMDVLFNKNRITPDSPNFVYDLRVDFDETRGGANKERAAIWDDDC